jgi:uncharacterized protein DUF6335
MGPSESRSLTAHLVDSLATGLPVAPLPEEETAGPEALLMLMGDPDVSPLQSEYVGDESPGATTPTPDQNLIDETGRAYGIDHAQSGALRTSSELLDRRDEARSGLGRVRAARAI